MDPSTQPQSINAMRSPTSRHLSLFSLISGVWITMPGEKYAKTLHWVSCYWSYWLLDLCFDFRIVDPKWKKKLTLLLNFGSTWPYLAIFFGWSSRRTLLLVTSGSTLKFYFRSTRMQNRLCSTTNSTISPLVMVLFLRIALRLSSSHIFLLTSIV